MGKTLKQHNINQCYIEIGWRQGTAVAKLMQKNRYNAITTLKDSAQKNRVVAGRVDNVAITADKK